MSLFEQLGNALNPYNADTVIETNFNSWELSRIESNKLLRYLNNESLLNQDIKSITKSLDNLKLNDFTFNQISFDSLNAKLNELLEIKENITLIKKILGV